MSPAHHRSTYPLLPTVTVSYLRTQRPAPISCLPRHHRNHNSPPGVCQSAPQRSAAIPPTPPLPRHALRRPAVVSRPPRPSRWTLPARRDQKTSRPGQLVIEPASAGGRAPERHLPGQRRALQPGDFACLLCAFLRASRNHSHRYTDIRRQTTTSRTPTAALRGGDRFSPPIPVILHHRTVHKPPTTAPPCHLHAPSGPCTVSASRP